MRRPIWLAPVLLCTTQLSCATLSSAVSSAETFAAKSFISDDQENQIGLQVKQQIETQQNAVYLTDPVINQYVSDLANKVLASATQERPGVTWLRKRTAGPGSVQSAFPMT